ncbi:MAG: HNH endonuclease [Gammaproteobacteria bacterium]|nr:HNH endonuclease [Gammaproteobacteria bacterium]
MNNTATHRAKKLNAYVAPVTQNHIGQMMEQQHGRCAFRWCGASLDEGYHVDHIVPLSRGGTHEPGNVQLLCPRCNISKGAKPIEDVFDECGDLGDKMLTSV